MAQEPVRLIDLHPKPDNILSAVTEGLGSSPKTLPAKFFYDKRGSELFEQICELEEYYLTRTETAILEAHAGAMAELIGAGCRLVEFGSGSSSKTRILLDHLQSPSAYVPVDISREHLLESATQLAEAYPEIEMLPVCADYTHDFPLPEPSRPASRTVGFFPGSTIGNFHAPDAVEFLRFIRALTGDDGGLLVGVDLKKDPAILIPAYDDSQGVTAEFNFNLLERINRELDADFDRRRFEHRPRYNAELGRMESHLMSREDHEVTIADQTFPLEKGEGIRTECSYKYGLSQFRGMASDAGFEVSRVWTDAKQLFSVQFLAAG